MSFASFQWLVWQFPAVAEDVSASDPIRAVVASIFIIVVFVGQFLCCTHHGLHTGLRQISQIGFKIITFFLSENFSQHPEGASSVKTTLKGGANVIKLKPNAKN